MNSRDLRPDQLERVGKTLVRHRDFLRRLRDRMRALSFPSDDPMLDATKKAYESASNLSIMVLTQANNGKKQRQAVEPSEMERKPWAG